MQWLCRVCGFDLGADVWGGDENLNCTYDICDCCGAEAGTDDFDVKAVRRYRAKWIADGRHWFSSASKPADWDFEAQASHIPMHWH